MTAIDRATTDAEAVIACADRLGGLGYESIRDVLIVGAVQAQDFALRGHAEQRQHLAVLRSQCDGLITELEAGRP